MTPIPLRKTNSLVQPLAMCTFRSDIAFHALSTATALRIACGTSRISLIHDAFRLQHAFTPGSLNKRA